jgi:transcriptional regulator with XRE-family HTH domain
MSATTRPRRKTPVDHDPNALVWARKAAGWRQATLARELGISPSTLCEAEKGTRGLAPDVMKRLAATLNCPVTVFERKADAR